MTDEMLTATDPEATPLDERALEDANAHFARFEAIKRFSVLSSEWSVDGGELTPTLKLKRRVIYKKYEAEIERLYT